MTLTLFLGILSLFVIAAAFGAGYFYCTPKHELWAACFIAAVAGLGILIGTQVAQVLK
jgi:hypothetical protein